MPRFVINKNAQTSGEHEVHNATTGCSFMPNPGSQIDLGIHASCHGAVTEAKNRWPNHKIDGCYYCCLSCHTG